jgi:biotin-(acetyl-CoA carboxylase) ligase
MTDAADDETPSFPPLLRGLEVARGQDPFTKAVAEAALGADPGLLVWARRADRMDAALVLAPEAPLGDALSIALAAALGLGDALGALAPPEVAVHFVWPGGFRVNGAVCGQMRAAASTEDAEAEPDWLVIGITVPFLPETETDDPGLAPDRTCLWEEGCSEITPHALLESWSRHTLVWINTWMDEGLAPLHAAWTARAWKMGEPLPVGGVFMGLDEHGNQLVRLPERTELRPLTLLLEGA